MKLILVHPNDMKAVYGDTLKYTACEPPFWCAVIAQFCLDHGVDVQVIDAEAENLSPQQVAERAADSAPALVGIIVTGTNLSASTQKMQGADLTCRVIKETDPKIPVFLWGLHPSALPERTLLENDADYVVAGEGLETIVNLVRYHKNKTVDFSPEVFPGLYFREDGEIKGFPKGKLMETKDIPMPAWQLFPMKNYMPHNWHIMGEEDPKAAKGRYGVIAASIGCPFNCTFCAISAQFGAKTLRYWDAERVVDEIERLVKEHNVKYIKILDECFVLNKKYVSNFCDLLIERNLDVNMWGYARIDTVSPELLKKLKTAGVHWLAYGIESADDTVLKDVEKSQFNSADVRQVMQWNKDAGINVIANFMFGLPEDTMESMQKTLELARDICPEWINFSVTMPYPGSKDYFDAFLDGRITEDKWIQYAQYSYECTPLGGKHLSPREVLQFRDYAFNAFFEDNSAFFDNIQEKFGAQYVGKIKEMTKNKLRRRLLGD